MALKVEIPCSRCKKTHLRTVSSAQEAADIEALTDKKRARLGEIAAFFEKIPVSELPDFMVISGGESSVLHMTLCDPDGEDAKRSCKKRVAELLKQAGELEPRKPRTGKKEAVIPLTQAVEEKPAK